MLMIVAVSTLSQSGSLSGSQRPEVQWATGYGSTSSDYNEAVATDASGTYTVGHFHGTFSAGHVSLTSAGGFDAVVTKVGPDGKVVWATQLGGPGWDKGWGIATDGNGGVYATGEFGTTTGCTTIACPSTFGSFTLSLDDVRPPCDSARPPTLLALAVVFALPTARPLSRSPLRQAPCEGCPSVSLSHCRSLAFACSVPFLSVC